MRIKLRPITCLAVPFAAGILVVRTTRRIRSPRRASCSSRRRSTRTAASRSRSPRPACTKYADRAVKVGAGSAGDGGRGNGADNKRARKRCRRSWHACGAKHRRDRAAGAIRFVSMAWRASAAILSASSGVISVAGRSSASRSAAATSIVAAWMTRISPASCCSTAGAARQRARRRICAASKNRLAWRTSASGRDKMMTMMMTEHVPGQR